MSQFFYIAPIKVQVSNNAFTDIAHCVYIIRQYSDFLFRANRHDTGWRQLSESLTTSSIHTLVKIIGFNPFNRRYTCPCCVIVYWSFLRSEEHTSELQSLMRISYAVFCLKKKN